MDEREGYPTLDAILEKALSGIPLSPSEIVYLLSLKESREASRVYQTARYLRAEHFGNKIFLYGFVYFSTFCRNNCTFCSSRSSNRLASRYRKSESEIIDAACLLADSGVHLIDLTMGEDPFFHGSARGYDTLLQAIRHVKRATGLPVMVSPGVVPEDVLRNLAGAGADWYACYQETHNRQLFGRLRPGQDFETRISSKIEAKRSGMLIEEGIMTGVGESFSDIAESMAVIRELGAHQARVMSFVPQAGTPMADNMSPSRSKELMIIAILRLLFPDRLIPASLDVDGIDLLQERLDAGANVITSLIPPRLGLSGVSQPSKGIEEGSRSAGGVIPLLHRSGLDVASRSDYLRWVNAERSPKTDVFMGYGMTA